MLEVKAGSRIPQPSCIFHFMLSEFFLRCDWLVDNLNFYFIGKNVYSHRKGI